MLFFDHFFVFEKFPTFLLVNRFLRHWNRGEYNSCARTDLTFKPAPESHLSRRREERARKAAEKEREEHKVDRNLVDLTFIILKTNNIFTEICGKICS